MRKRSLIFQLTLVLVVLFIGLSPRYSAARPISYAGGWTTMFNSLGESYSLHHHYSPTAKYSLGLRFESLSEEQERFENALIQLNVLAKRWNLTNSQTNIYLKSGLGFSHTQAKFPVGSLSLAFDSETRRLFGSYQASYVNLGVEPILGHAVRVGLAPYVGGYGDLHTWLMLEAKQEGRVDSSVVWTPLVRFFKGVYLVEFGVDSDEQFLFNLIIRY